MSKRHVFACLILLLSATAVLAGERVSVIIELQSPPAVESYLGAMAAGKSGGSTLRAAVTAARNEIAVVEAEQQGVVDRIEALGNAATVLFRVQRVFNGIGADVDAAQLEAIRKMPGVKSVEPLPMVRMDNTSSVPLIGAPEVWRALAPNGATGKNVKVGVIDTGIDYIHKDFGGDGNYAGKTFVGDTFPATAKVVGGVDLAGDSYDSSSSDANLRTPKPDGDPMDCDGHGSHVSGTIGGYGLKKDLTTYTGPYDVPYDAALFSIGPGVAPEAKLYAIRVFGCPAGTTGLITPALEWALDPNKDGDFSDRMDVVNMSLGGTFGSHSNVNTIAADNLARAGCVVVASAGNSGDTYYIVGSPSTGDHVMSVAASVDALDTVDALQIDAPASIATVYLAHHAANFGWLTATPVKGTIARPVQVTGCFVFSASDKALLAGKIALLDWTDNECGTAVRASNAVVAGAIGVIFRHTKNDLDIAIAGSPTIPSTLVTKDTGDLILANLAGGGVTATLSGALLASMQVITPANNDLLASFSSRGPRTDDNGLKPEITAPGVTTFSVRALSGTRGVSFSGTSMAAPHVTGSMALLKQIHPDWTSDELKALAMSTATHDLFTGQNRGGSRYAVSRIGAGRIDVASAARTKGFMSTAQGEALGVIGASFGAPDVAGTYTATKSVVVLNKGSGTITTYRVAYDPAVTQPGVTFTVPASVTVPANGSATFPLTLTATSSAMKHKRDASLTAQPNGVTRSWLNEASGWVTLTADGQETLRLPVFAAPRAASAMSVVEKGYPGAASGTLQLHLAGTTLASGSGAEEVNAAVSAYELANAGARNISLPPYFNIEYTGIATDFAAQKAAGKGVVDSTIYFAIATFGPWTTPLQSSFRIDIDTNGDGTDDYRLYLDTLATFLSPSAGPSDVYVATVCTSAGGSCKRSFINGVDASVTDTVLFNTNVIVLPVRAADIGLAAGKSAITYRVRTGFSSGIDTMPRQSYDVANPGMSFSATSAAPFGFVDAPSNTISIAYDRTAFAAAKSRGILLLHHHNASGKHEEIVLQVAPPRHRAAGR